MPNLELTDAEAQFLRDLVGMWIEGYEPATDDVIQDRSFESPEDMLQSVASMYTHHEMSVSIYAKLRGDTPLLEPEPATS